MHEVDMVLGVRGAEVGLWGQVKAAGRQGGANFTEGGKRGALALGMDCQLRAGAQGHAGIK